MKRGCARATFYLLPSTFYLLLSKLSFHLLPRPSGTPSSKKGNYFSILLSSFHLFIPLSNCETQFSPFLPSSLITYSSIVFNFQFSIFNSSRTVPSSHPLPSRPGAGRFHAAKIRHLWLQATGSFQPSASSGPSGRRW